jgi:hypothetical protein
MKNRLARLAWIIIALIPALLFIAKFGGPSILKLYVQAGISHPENQAIFSLTPEPQIKRLVKDETYLAELKHYRLPQITISLPKEMKAVQGETTKYYYKRRPWRTSGSVAYLLYEKPNFFTGLFPQLSRQGIINDLEFLNRTMHARLEDIKTITDAFFVVMKGIFTPDLGDQKRLKIIKFSCEGKNGFISVNSGGKINYFDCNFFDPEGNFFKVCIRDVSSTLDLNKVCTIISTVKLAG